MQMRIYNIIIDMNWENYNQFCDITYFLVRMHRVFLTLDMIDFSFLFKFLQKK